jgi:hypothetical protein
LNGFPASVIVAATKISPLQQMYKIHAKKTKSKQKKIPAMAIRPQRCTQAFSALQSEFTETKTSAQRRTESNAYSLMRNQIMAKNV